MADQYNLPPTFCLSSISFSLSVSIVLGLAGLIENLDLLCVPVFPWFLLALAVALVLVSLVGILASVSRLHRTLFWCNLAILFLTVVFVGVFIFTGTSEIELIHWPQIQTCLRDTAACQVQENDKFAGCCQEPVTCSSSRDDGDCILWNTNVTHLCYECSSCQTTIFGVVRSMWRRLQIAFGICISLLLVVHAVQLYFYWSGTEQKQRQQEQLRELEMIPRA